MILNCCVGYIQLFFKSLAQLYDDSIEFWLRFCHQQLQKVDQNVGHLSMTNLLNKFWLNQFRNVRSVKPLTLLI